MIDSTMQRNVPKLQSENVNVQNEKNPTDWQHYLHVSKQHLQSVLLLYFQAFSDLYFGWMVANVVLAKFAKC